MQLRLAVITCFFVSIVSGQQSDCGWFGTMPVEKRRTSEPFKSAERILLISYFSAGRDGSETIIDGNWEEIQATDSVSIVRKMNLKILKEFDLSHLSDVNNLKYAALEITELNQAWKDSLSRWYFNYHPRKWKDDGTVEVIGCYFPRNAILFLDGKDRIVSYIEICFDCMGAAASQDIGWPDLIRFPMPCRISKLDVLKDIFRKNGIVYGIDGHNWNDFKIKD
ncbi:hypothetical protein [Flavobacterium silvaticum]|uniref:Uncharacterized protein n=1 Tax=Flavobacterium silvaticum TaxID=1852020 RepID=A0A972FMK9_9FLAO|nr:hypothetical protein [Flavobacterium silvaticum]NMH28824.1 hypothetical protein [Flavobacterium silvaticum]